jgi:hypothetical protein
MTDADKAVMQEAVLHARRALLREDWKIGEVAGRCLFALRRTEQDRWLYAGVVLRREGRPPIGRLTPKPGPVDFIVEVLWDGERFAPGVGYTCHTREASAAARLSVTLPRGARASLQRPVRPSRRGVMA